MTNKVNRKRKNNTKRQVQNNKLIWILIVVLILTNIICLGLFISEKDTNVKLNQENRKQATVITKQKKSVIELEETKDVRNYKSVKKATDKGLEGAINAIYNWNGNNYAERYSKAEKYMSRDVLKQIATNGKIPSKKSQRQQAKNLKSMNAINKVTEIENGIQDIQGNTVTGFVWVTQTYSQYNKNSTITQQVKYKYDIVSKKFIEFNPEPFSGATV